MRAYRCSIVWAGWEENRLVIGISQIPKTVATVSGVVCRRSEFCQARSSILNLRTRPRPLFYAGNRHSIPRTEPIKRSRPAENHTPGVSPFYVLCVSYSPNILRHQLTRSELF